MLSMVGKVSTALTTDNGKSGFDSGEDAHEIATTLKKMQLVRKLSTHATERQ